MAPSKRRRVLIPNASRVSWEDEDGPSPRRINPGGNCSRSGSPFRATRHLTNRREDHRRQGAVLPGVAIVVTNEETGVFREVTSSAEGTYSARRSCPAATRSSRGWRASGPWSGAAWCVQVGTTLTINLTLPVGGIEETVTVTGQSPLVDTTSATRRRQHRTAELSELPAMNRNYFSAVALLPGVQFSPSNQMGNDTIVAGGQTTQNNNVSVDGGYNADDALGTSSGAQVRTPLEAIQEFQVLTSMYDAEFGRASGAIVNAVTKSGTNQFKGVVVRLRRSNALTAKDYLRQAEQPGEADDDQARMGRRARRADRQEQGALLRQPRTPGRQPEPRRACFRSRPALRLLDRRGAHRLEHAGPLRPPDQREAHVGRPLAAGEGAAVVHDRQSRTTLESFQDETDLDQTAVGTLTSVFGNARVNTVRVARTWEHWWHGNECFRAQGGDGDRPASSSAKRRQAVSRCARRSSSYPSFLAQASTESQGPWDSNYQIEDDYSWFIPGKKGDHDVKFGVRYNYTELERVSQINENGTFTFNTDLPFDPANPRTYPERLTIRMGTFNEFIKNHTLRDCSCRTNGGWAAARR